MSIILNLRRVVRITSFTSSATIYSWRCQVVALAATRLVSIQPIPLASLKSVSLRPMPAYANFSALDWLLA